MNCWRTNMYYCWNLRSGEKVEQVGVSEEQVSASKIAEFLVNYFGDFKSLSEHEAIRKQPLSSILSRKYCKTFGDSGFLCRSTRSQWHFVGKGCHNTELVGVLVQNNNISTLKLN